MNRNFNLYMARLYLREARVRAVIPAQRNFCFVLLTWAGNCRLRAMQPVAAQGELFGGVA